MIDIKGICHTYITRGQATESLRDVSFTAEDSEFVTIVGPSGCGKSTLLKIIADILSPTDGHVLIHSRSPAEARQNREIGIVFQDPVLLAWRKNWLNVSLPLEILNVSPEERRRRSLKLLELVGLLDFSEKLPRELSGGMRQRVSIARALSINPSILLMDEPFGALDEMTRERMNMEIQSIWAKERKTILFVTHSIPEAVFLGDRVVVMSARPGRVLDVVEVTLPRPRVLEIREEKSFLAIIRAVRESSVVEVADD